MLKQQPQRLAWDLVQVLLLLLGKLTALELVVTLMLILILELVSASVLVLVQLHA